MFLKKNENSDQNKVPSVKKNYFYNVVYQIILLILPMITAPYISRTLDASSIGQNTFANTMASYFITLGSFGFGYYAQRLIASFQGDKHQQSKSFWEIILCRGVIIGSSVLVLVILLICGVFQQYTDIMWIYVIPVAACFFDLTFFFAGNEKFLSLSTMGLLIKIASVVSIFIFVKTNDDLLSYVIILCVSTFLNYAVMWLFIPKRIERVPFEELNIKQHFLPAFRLFIPNIAISIYGMLDKSLIVFLIHGETERIVDGVSTMVSNADLENGFYTEAEQIVKMCLTIITSLGAVLIPRNSMNFAKGNILAVKENVYKAAHFVWMLGIPMTIGLTIISPVFIPVFYGSGYERSVVLMMILSPLVLAIGFNNMLGVQYMIATKKDKQFTISVSLGALINLILTLALIPSLWSYGAAIGTVVAETLICVIQCFFVRRELSMKTIFLSSVKYWLSGLFMFGVTFPLSYFVFSAASISNLIFLIAIGIVSYFLCLLVLRDEFLLSEVHAFFTKIHSFVCVSKTKNKE